MKGGRAGLELRNFEVRDIVANLRDAERKGVLVSCCVAADAPLLEAFGQRYGIRVPVPGDTMDPELRSPEDAIVVIRQHSDYPVGKNGLAMVPLDIKLFAMPVEQEVE